MASLGSLVTNVIANVAPFQKGMRQAQGSMKATQKAMGALRSAAGALGIAFGAAGVVGALKSAVGLASDMEETTSKFNVVFGQNAASMTKFSDDLADSLGRSRLQVRGFLASAQDLFVPMGATSEQGEKLSKTITQLTVDLASFNNMNDADVFRDLAAAITGSGETMKKYGVIVSQSRVNQELLNQGLDPKTATEYEKAMARVNLILAGTQAAQGDAERTGDSFANTMKRFNAEMETLGVALGQTILPVLNKLIARVNELLGDILPFLEEEEERISATDFESRIKRLEQLNDQIKKEREKMRVLGEGGFGAALGLALGGATDTNRLSDLIGQRSAVERELRAESQGIAQGSGQELIDSIRENTNALNLILGENRRQTEVLTAETY